MTPQLFRNYFLKSVEHMPWRVVCCKFLNTFIDDIAACIIRMPKMHRWEDEALGLRKGSVPRLQRVHV